MILVEDYNFIEYNFSLGSNEKQCSEIMFVSGDEYKDFISIELPTGTVSVQLLDNNKNILQTLSAANSEFSYNSNVLILDFTINPVAQIKQAYISVSVDAIETLCSATFLIYPDDREIRKKTTIAKYARDENPNDFIQLRLPVSLINFSPVDDGTRFETTNRDLKRPVKRQQLEIDVVSFAKAYESFHEKIWNAFRNDEFRFKINGFFREIIFEDEFELETFDRTGDFGYTQKSNLVAKVKINDGLKPPVQDNLDTFAVLAQPYANAEVKLITANQPGDETYTYKILLDKPVIDSEIQNVNYKVVPVGSNPATGLDFVGGSFPNGIIAFNPLEVQKQINVIVNSGLFLQSGVNFDIEFTDTNLIKFTQVVEGLKISISQNLVFGDTPLGFTKIIQITVENISAASITVSSITAGNPFASNTNSFTLVSGGTKDIVISFAPLTNQAYNRDLIFNFTDGTNQTFAMSGTGIIIENSTTDFKADDFDTDEFL